MSPSIIDSYFSSSSASQPPQNISTYANKERIVAYLLKARTVEAEKQPLPGNARTQQ
jgi:hypothetical protein